MAHQSWSRGFHEGVIAEAPISQVQSNQPKRFDQLQWLSPSIIATVFGELHLDLALDDSCDNLGNAIRHEHRPAAT